MAIVSKLPNFKIQIVVLKIVIVCCFSVESQPEDATN